MKKKIIPLSTGVLLLTFLFAGCNGNAASEEAENSQRDESSASVEENSQRDENPASVEENSENEQETLRDEEIKVLEDELTEMEASLEKQEEKINTLDNQLEVSQNRSDTLKEQLEEARTNAAAAEEELEKLDNSEESDLSLRGDGFYTQIWMDDNPPEEMEGWDPGTTDWQSSPREIKDSFSAGTSQYTAPERLVFDWLSAEGMLEQKDSFDELAIRTKFVSNEEVEILVLEWGLRDDATAGNDYLFHMKKENEAWGISELEERYHCRRGISEVDGKELCK